jgi:hypothetical protein
MLNLLVSCEGCDWGPERALGRRESTELRQAQTDSLLLPRVLLGLTGQDQIQ